ncbi:MAG: hypothetical protein AAF281_08380, partial [Pseudomonadota bacterium]
ILAGQENILISSCDIDFGASGAPIVVETEQGPRIASVVSAMARWQGQNVALGAMLGPSVEALIDDMKATDPVFRSHLVKEAPPSLNDQLGRSTLTRRLPQIREERR